MLSKFIGSVAVFALCASTLVAESAQRSASLPSPAHALDDAQSLARAYAAIAAAEEALQTNPEARAAFGDLLNAARRQLNTGVAKAMETLPASPESGDNWPVEFLPEHAQRPANTGDLLVASRRTREIRQLHCSGSKPDAATGLRPMKRKPVSPMIWA